MAHFDLEDQRTAICLVALVILVGESVSGTLGGHTLPDGLNYVLGTLAAGPLLDSALSRSRETKDPRRSSSRRSDREDQET